MNEDYIDKNKTTSSKRILIIGGVAAGTSPLQRQEEWILLQILK